MACRSYSGILAWLGLGFFFLCHNGNVFAAKFPEKAITFVVQVSPGSGGDQEARGIAPYVSKYLGVPVNIENNPGADGRIALNRVWKAKPDGYTLITQSTSASVIGEFIFKPEYREADFSHIYAWSETNQVLVVAGDNTKTIDEFIKDVRRSRVVTGIPSRAGVSHMVALMFADAAGFRANFVVFEGAAECVAALAGKHIDFAVVNCPSALPMVKAGKLRPLLVFANQKDSVYPNVPLAREAGYDFHVVSMVRGADGPPHMDPGIVKILEDAFAKAVKDPGYLEWAKKIMLNIVPLNHEEYGKFIKDLQQVSQKYIHYFQEK